MNSIRWRLTLGLLGSLAFLWLLAGAGTYLSVRHGLFQSIDTELALDAQVLRFVARGEEPSGPDPFPEGGARRGAAVRRLQARIPAYDEIDSGHFYQSWSESGADATKSDSLGERNLPRPELDGSEPEFSTMDLEDGTQIRVMAFESSPGGRGRSRGDRRRGEGPTLIAVARDLAPISQTLSTFLGGILLVGILIAVAAAFLVSLLVKRALHPLERLSHQSQGIDASSLDSRFPIDGVPSELIPVYECLNDLLARIETSFDRERRFSSDLAHEIRTPIAELRMIAESALKWPDEAGENVPRESLEIAEQLESMVENLLKLARWESGEIEIDRQLVQPVSLVETSWNRLSTTASRRNLTLNIEDASGPGIETDPAFLSHLLENLLSNAVEYSDPDTTIDVRIDDQRIEIGNTHSGITETDIGRFFDRYWRGDSARSASGHAGLGLSLSRACAEALDASLDARLEGERVILSLRWKSPQKTGSSSS